MEPINFKGNLERSVLEKEKEKREKMLSEYFKLESLSLKNIRKTIEVARKISNDIYKSEAFLEISKTLAEVKEFDKAIGVAEKISHE
jgi:uncharacterized tellurite resistance protein B-like protein